MLFRSQIEIVSPVLRLPPSALPSLLIYSFGYPAVPEGTTAVFKSLNNKDYAHITRTPAEVDAFCDIPGRGSSLTTSRVGEKAGKRCGEDEGGLDSGPIKISWISYGGHIPGPYRN